MLCKRSLSLIKASCKATSAQIPLRALSVSSNEVATSTEPNEVTRSDLTRPLPLSPHFKPITRQEISLETIWPHKDSIRKMYAEANDRDKKYVTKEKGDLISNHSNVQQVIKRREVQAFIDNLETKFLGEVAQRNEEADEFRAEVGQVGVYPECLLGLDPFNYIREEEMFDEFNDAEFPLGIDDLVSTSEPVNKVPLRTPVDFAYLVKNEGVLQGTGEFFKVFFGQGKASFLAKYGSLKNRGYDHNLSDRSFRGKNLAAQLQERYLKHFDLIANERWEVLLDYMADFKAIDMMNKCNQSEPEVVKSWFTVNFIKNNKKPKILSHFEVPYEDKKFVQVLVKFDMEVECLNFDEDRNASFGQHNMVHYVIFERNLKDFLSTYRIIDKVSEKDLKRFKRNKLEVQQDDDEE